MPSLVPATLHPRGAGGLERAGRVSGVHYSNAGSRDVDRRTIRPIYYCLAINIFSLVSMLNLNYLSVFGVIPK